MTVKCLTEWAALLPLDAIDDLPMDVVSARPEEVCRAVRLWAWLLGICPADADAMAHAHREVSKDGGLLLALSLPAAEFLEWFRRADWEPFDRSQEDGEVWAWTVLDRARAGVAALGAMAGQVPLRAPV